MFIRLRTARPDDWSGRLTDLAVMVAALLVAPVVLLARLPPAWIALMGGYGWPIRVVLALAVAWTFMWIDNLLRVLLPRTPYLIGRTLTVRARGHRLPLKVREIRAIHVETRPPDGRETFVVEMRTGEHHDLCPVAWTGAGRMYRRMARALNLGK
jgi:hypothetical protein